MLRATLKSLLARKVRLVLSGLAVVLGVMFVAGSFVLTDTLSRSFDSIFSDVYSQTDVTVAGKAKVEIDELDGEPVPSNIPQSAITTVSALPGVAQARGVIAADGATMIGSNGKAVGSFGPPQLGENWMGENELTQLREGRGPTADDEIAVNVGLATAGKVKVGDQVGVLTLDAKQRMFTIVGTFGYSGDRDSLGGVNEVAFTEPVAQRLMLGEPGVFSSIDVRATDGTSPEALKQQVASALGADYTVRTGTEAAADDAQGLKSALGFFNNILLGFAGVALFVGIFLIINTFSIVVAQRTKELALLRAIGAGRRQVIGSVLTEAVIVGTIASVIGLGAGIGVGALLAFLASKFSGGLALAGLGVPPIAIIASFVVGLVVTVIAAVMPALRASRIPPIAAMADVATPDRPLTKITWIGGVLTAIALALLGVGLYADGGIMLVAGGVLLTFIGVALLTPVLSRPVVGLLGRIFSWSVPGKLGRLNSGRNPRRTAITAAALMVGIALVTGVGVIVSSAKTSIAGAVESVDAQLIIQGTQTGPRAPTFAPAVVDQAKAVPGVRDVVGVASDLATVDGEQQFVTSVTDAAPIPGIYGSTAVAGSISSQGPDQVIVNADAAKEHNWSVGSVLTVQLTRGAEHRYTVSGIAPTDKSIGEIMLPAAAMAEFTQPALSLGFVRLDEGTAVASVQPKIEALVADNPLVSVIDQDTFTQQQSGMLDQVLVMIQILLALAILIAVLGIINTLALSVMERTRELGLLRAIGLGRAATMRMITVEAVVISVFGALLGVVVGTGLGAAVVRALRDEGFTDLTLPWSTIVLYLGVAALVGVVAAILPSIRAARLNVLGAIAHE
ncbi:membrane protein [Asanoa ishikariensis]|uniref:Putative ABC transport system permease protein n=1 Tax=Asanoa ishikariensis TaxID=137265 RepID=A0A1H3TTW3_9ACTN|nr:ABC transporter permease [Asanoa ishikariensis]GIF67424.1 membrane protein [Asanoa ishikariensis]SDZ53261.1 putative ABC transport system permease protein [Asanoa ishikariensis]